MSALRSSPIMLLKTLILEVEAKAGGFHGGPVARTPHSQCKGVGLTPSLGTKIAMCQVAQPKIKKRLEAPK